MNFVPSTKLAGIVLIESQVFSDNRGYFLESYNQKTFADNGIAVNFVQDNHSYSKELAVLRGLHLQKPPYAQDKLVRVTRGKVFDVVVDLRPGSATFAQWEAYELSAENFKQLFIPAGFAHGFQTLTPDVEFQYKCSNFYNKESEVGINYLDPDINISWPLPNPVMSEKDKVNPFLSSLKL